MSYYRKDFPKHEAYRAAHENPCPQAVFLTFWRSQIAKLLLLILTLEEISKRLFVRREAVATHTTSIYRKMQVHSHKRLRGGWH
jgi:DNA-binding NarL/FixJ family response regulator